jgi:uncharacterized membrane protein
MFGQLMAVALAKLHLGPMAALLIMIGIVVGSVINIPVHRISHDKAVYHHSLAIFGLSDLFPELRRTGSQTIIAVNVGGCLIPTGLAVYELIHLVATDPLVVVHVAIASIGGAGTFDGIVLSGIVAAYLA